MGGRMPLSTELASAVRGQLDRAARGVFDDLEMKALRAILELQARWSIVPRKKTLLIEKYVSRDGYHLFIFPFEGHLVNEGFGALLAYRLTRSIPLTFSIAVNDYGLELLSDREIPFAPDRDGADNAAGLSNHGQPPAHPGQLREAGRPREANASEAGEESKYVTNIDKRIFETYGQIQRGVFARSTLDPASR
jgi:ATP-dependent Lhr-like helicase